MNYDVVAVNIFPRLVRLLAEDKTSHDVEVIMKIAVFRRGVDTEFYAKTLVGVYHDGDIWVGSNKEKELDLLHKCPDLSGHPRPTGEEAPRVSFLKDGDWRSLCCGAPMYGEPASNPSYGHYGWCSTCGDASEFEDLA